MARHYELVLMLDPETGDADRDRVAGDVRNQIEAHGTLDHQDSWGVRKLAYEIRQRNEAEYRFFRFQSESKELLDSLDHSLKIADGVLRFRIFKVDADAPIITPPAPGQATGGERRGGPRRPHREDDRAGPPESERAAAPEAQPTPPAEAEPTTAPEAAPPPVAATEPRSE